MKVVVAGKNNIAIDVISYITRFYPKNELFAVINKNDYGVDGFQKSYKKHCIKLNIPIISLEAAYSIENALFLSLEYDRIVVPMNFSHDRLYNVHFSKLPKYKGMYTSAWPILNGEKKSGVTLHKIDRGIDTGDIIAQCEFFLDDNETAKSLYLKYIKTGTNLVLNMLERLLVGDFDSCEQSIVDASYYGKGSIDYSNIVIDMNKTAFEIKNQINAFSFRDYQLPKINDVSIFGAKLTSKKSGFKPGVIIDESNDTMTLSTIDYDVILYKDLLEEFHFLCEIGNVERLTELSENELLINEKNKKGWSAIIVSAYHGQIEALRFLLSRGACINDFNYNGTSVLMYAKEYLERSGDYEFFQTVIELGADLNQKDYSGLTVRDYVVKTGNDFSKSFFDC